jgi:hypothetical protein
MAAKNSTTESTKKESVVDQKQETDQENHHLLPLCSHFDLDALDGQSALIQRAGRDLEHAYQAASTIDTIAELLLKNDISKDFREDVFTPAEEGALMQALILVARGLAVSLEDTASFFSDNLSPKQGGAK